MRPARRLAATAVAAALALVAAVLASGARAHTYTYTIETRGTVEGDVEWFRQIASSALGDERGWAIGGHNEFVEVTGDADFRLILASPEEVDAAHPVCSERWSCRVSNQILVNDFRWRHGTETWADRNRNAYRRYVVNHEVGHWLGFGHLSGCGRGNRAPVMMQQSIDLEGCETNVWPLYREWIELGEREYWPSPLPGWFWPWLKWFIGHEEYTGLRSPVTRPEDAPSPTPLWAWEWLPWYLGIGPYADEPFRDPDLRPDSAPVPIPGWAWAWMKWYIGHDDYTTRRSPVTRPDAAPVPTPDWAWARLSVFLGARRLG